jgi:aspartate aminotransferase
MLVDSLRRQMDFVSDSTWARRRYEPGVADLAFGTSHTMPLPEVVDALRQWSQPLTRDWFSYSTSEPDALGAVAASLREAHGLPFRPEDVALTSGGSGAIIAALKAVVEPGEEVIVFRPHWFFYDPLILDAGALPVKVDLDRETFEIDLAALELAITPRTRVVIVNSPHNPSGKVASTATLRGVAQLLTEYSERHGRPIYVISDEPFRRIVFDGHRAYSPAACYARTFIAYSYGKVLLMPGQRVGYLAMPPEMPDREQLREAIFAAQTATGWAFPNTLTQHALVDLERYSIDVDHLERRRDRLVGALREIGYRVWPPEGTFFMLARTPWEDDQAFAELLAECAVLVLPGTVFEYPGHFRISLTASDATIERSLAGFREAFAVAQREQEALCSGTPSPKLGELAEG